MQETRVWSLGGEDPLEKEMATHSGILAWRISWTEEPGRLQSMASQRARHDWACMLIVDHILFNLFTCFVDILGGIALFCPPPHSVLELLIYNSNLSSMTFTLKFSFFQSNSLAFFFFFFFWPHWTTCGIPVPDQGLNSGPWNGSAKSWSLIISVVFLLNV